MSDWLKQQNQGRMCGWEATPAAASAPANESTATK